MEKADQTGLNAIVAVSLHVVFGAPVKQSTTKFTQKFE